MDKGIRVLEWAEEEYFCSSLSKYPMMFVKDY